VVDAAVSVLVATCRGGKYLELAFDSLRDQTLTDFEAVIVDDGSPNPAEIDALAARLERVTVIHQRRSGLAISRNVSLSLASGEFIAFLDDDDLYEPEKLERQIAELRAHPDAIGCHTQFTLIDGAGRLTGRGDGGPFDLRSLLRGELHPFFATMLIRKCAIDRCGWFSSNFPNREDLDLLYRLAREGEFRFLREPLYRYRLRHSTNMSHQLVHSTITSIEALEIQQNWAAMAGDDEMRADATIGLKRVKGYWIETGLSAAVASARKGAWNEAFELATMAFRLDPMQAVSALARKGGAARRKRKRGSAPEY
jgi:GT2 family glycosyltransferase